MLEHGADLTGVWYRDDTDQPHKNWTFHLELPPLTEWGEERLAAAKPTWGPNAVPVVSETNDPAYQCLPPGTPRIYFHPRPFEILQTPGRVLIFYEYQQLMRHIYTDGREHRIDLAPMWMGDSIGHWEGETLVVETVNFNDKTWIDRRGIPHSDQLRVVERIRKTDGDHLVVEVRIEDPIAFEEPWAGTKEFASRDWTIEEFVCLDDASFEAFEEVLLEADG